jgi:predicted DNA-binding ribbon-helix-helix protein
VGESRLVNRNVIAERGRTSMRLEPELWDALSEICARERIDVGELVRRIEAERPPGGRTSAVRVYIVKYFRQAATDNGHSREGHGLQDASGRAALAQPFAA